MTRPYLCLWPSWSACTCRWWRRGSQLPGINYIYFFLLRHWTVQKYAWMFVSDYCFRVSLTASYAVGVSSSKAYSRPKQGLYPDHTIRNPHISHTTYRCQPTTPCRCFLDQTILSILLQNLSEHLTKLLYIDLKLANKNSQLV